jgi:tartrate/fumarate subfamily iron-sulfur-dependent hydro-lyase alpha chain
MAAIRIRRRHGLPITREILFEVAVKLFEKATRSVPSDTLAALEESLRSETNELARYVLAMMIKNARMAAESNMVVCQDTGLPAFFLGIGTDAELKADPRKVLAEAVEKVSLEFPYRAAFVHPIFRDSTPLIVGGGIPLVICDPIAGADFVEITMSPQASGPEFWSRVEMFPPSGDPWETVKGFVLETVKRAGGAACPPVVVGVGLGGDMGEVAKLAKLASIRPINERNPDPRIASMEGELRALLNGTGIGPMGLGGDTTALAVNIEVEYCMKAWLPAAVCLRCWTNRRARARVHNDGRVEFL